MHSDFITIGQIVRAIGIKGELKVVPLTDDPERFLRLKVVYIDERPYKVSSCRIDRGSVRLALAGVPDRTAAEKLKDKYVTIDRVNAVPLEEGSYFIADIIGCKLFLSDGSEVGKITDVDQFGAADVFTASDGRRVVRFPFLKKMIVKVAPESGVIVLDKGVFDEVSVYED